ncbi:MAG TPA: hypothetical protein VKU82_00360 [Planctomycetaceae bacterium]|nr:hypothetical protein [Planctomycetaceae bacterium]
MKVDAQRSYPIAESAPLRIAGWSAIAAGIGARGGLLFGLAFMGLAFLMAGESWFTSSAPGYFALCGAIAGILVGACGAIVLNRVEPDEADNIKTGDRSRAFCTTRRAERRQLMSSFRIARCARH